MMMLCVIMMSICPVEVFGHSGRTDGSGGHYNRSTGEYHWHHGYGAHQHEDMDGDGDLDCPYDFRDTTGSSSGSSSSGSSTYSRPPASPTPYRTPLPRNTPTPDPEMTSPPNAAEADENNDNEQRRHWKVAFIIVSIAALLIVVLIQHGRIRNLQYYHKREIDLYKEKREEELAIHKRTVQQLEEAVIKQKRDEEQRVMSLKEAHRYEVRKLQRKLSTVSKVALRSISLDSQISVKNCIQKYDTDKTIDIPKDVYFLPGFRPVNGKVTLERIYGDYTVFVSKHGQCYHSDPYCSGMELRPAHVFDVFNKKRRCEKCFLAPSPNIPQWYIDLSEIYDRDINK